MNIFNKIALQGLKKNRARTAVTVIGVILSSAMITAVASFAVSLQTYMVNGAIVKYGGWHVGFLDTTASFVQERADDSRAADTASYENIGYAMLDGGKNPGKPYLFIAGFSRETFDALPTKLLSGRLPENSGEILIPAHVASNGGVKIPLGSTLTLAVGRRTGGSGNLSQHDPYISGDVPGTVKETFLPETEKTYTVVGICQRPSFEEYAAPGYTLITAADPASTADSFSTFVSLKKPRQVRSYASGTAEGRAYVFNDNVLRFMGLSDDNLFNAMLYSVGGILIALIMLGSIFLIYNSFTISMNDRIRQFGILLSVGATERQLRSSVLFEGLCIGAAGIPAGILAGIPSIKFVLFLVSKNFGNILYDTVPLTLCISFPAIAAAAVFSMVTILISAYIPARKAAATPVMECIRQTNEVKLEARSVKTSKFMERIYGLEGTLALKNFKRNKRQYRSIVLSLTLSTVLFVSANSFASHLKQAAERAVVSTDYDICFYTQDMDETGLFRLYDELKTASGVYQSSYQAILSYSCAVNTGELSETYRKSAGLEQTEDTVSLSMDLQFVEDRVFLNFIESLGLPPEEYTGTDAKIIAVAKARKADSGKDGLIEIFADRSMNLTAAPKTIHGENAAGQEKPFRVTFVDTIPVDTLPKPPSEVTPYIFMAVVPYHLKPLFEAPDVPVSMGLTFLSKTPSQSVEEMKTKIDGAGVTAEYTLYNLYELFEQNRNIIFIVDLFTSVFVIMISLIAVANVFNTISTNIRLRRRELAMLRSVGMSDRNFNKMMGYECLFYGMRTLLFGLPAAGILSWLIYKWLTAGGADIDYIVPWTSIGISMCGVFLVIFITTLYAVRRIKKENIIDTLRDEMT